ncbi:MAG TPA: hypothetical protein VF383_14375 [Candidatus Dormibacteraeota bacterium]
MAARAVVIVAMLLGAAACGYDVSTTFNADGSATVGLKFLFPKSLMQAGSGASISGFGAADIAKANADLAAKYPGAKVALVTEGEESGAQLTIPFKSEKDAFAFLTQPTQLSPAGAASGAASGTGSSINLANTGGLFASATHTTSGQTDTYTFKTAPQPLASPSPGDPLGPDVLSSIFSVTFTLTVPNEITSAPSALFTLDRKTAIWKLSLTTPQTLTATTGPSVVLAALSTNNPQAQSPALVIGIAVVAIAVGLVVGMLAPWRRRLSPAVVPAAAPPGAIADFTRPATEPPAAASSWTPPGPPSDSPPPTPPEGTSQS